MNELIDVKTMWEQATKMWRNSLGWVVVCIATFFFGMALQNKLIVDDCKFAKVFRDGHQVYECQMRLK